MTTKEWICPKCGGICKRDEHTQVSIGRITNLRFWTCMKCGEIRVIENPENFGVEEICEQ
jgi:rRNA maturation protein Nop10